MENSRPVQMVVFCLTFILVAAFFSCTKQDAPVLQEDPGGSLIAFVSILPQQYLLKRIGGEHIQAEVLVGSGQSPHTFEPTPKQMARLESATLFFKIGVPFEDTLLAKITATKKNLVVVDSAHGIIYRKMSEANPDHHHEGGKDPHVWLSPKNAILISHNMTTALIKADPKNRTDYEAGFKDLVSDLQTLDKQCAEILAPYKGREILVWHPAFGYFTQTYGLVQVPVESEGKQPSARQLADLVDKSKKQGIHTVFVQSQFSETGAKSLAQQLGGTVSSLDPLAANYMENLRAMADSIKAGFAESAEK